MLIIRLSRGGTKNKPFYRIVLTENSRKIGGNPIKVLGFWDPKTKTLKADSDAVLSWQKKGAALSQKVKALLKK